MRAVWRSEGEKGRLMRCKFKRIMKWRWLDEDEDENQAEAEVAAIIFCSISKPTGGN